MTDTFKLSPLADADWPDEISDMRDGFAGDLNVYRTMAHHPALLRAWADLRQHIVNETALGPQGSEVAILRIGHRLGSSYEWNQHIVRARKRGLSDARILSMRGDPAAMEDADRLVCDAVDQLIDTHALTPDLAERFADAFGRAALLDLMATVGFYTVLGVMLNTFDTPLDEDYAQILAEHPL